MKNYLKTGLSFGLTSATITTLGLMIGLYASTNSKSVVLSGILIIALADAFSDSLGIHMSEEAKDDTSSKEVWLATFFTFISKFIFALTFAIPVLLFSIQLAVAVAIGWGLLILGVLSAYIAKENKESVPRTIFEHVGLAVVVIVLSDLVGRLVNNIFV